jgi:hypothetical protein
MKSGLFVLLCVAAPLALGCRTNPNQVLMEQEHRRLEDDNNDLENQLDQCERENESLKHELATLKQNGPAAPDGRDGAPPPPRIITPPPEIPQLPKIDLGTPDDPPSTKPAPAERPSTGGRNHDEKSGDSAPPSSVGRVVRDGDVRTASAAAPGQADRIVISRLFSGGRSSGSKPPDDGITVVFNPRTASGQAIEAGGDVAIVLIDPQLHGDASRIARWDFAAVEVASHYRRSGIAGGYHFELLWPDAPPKHGDLQLFVRLTTPDGQKLQADLPIHVRLAGEATQSWTKAATAEHWEAASGDDAPEELPGHHDSQPAETAPRGRDPEPPAVADKHHAEWSPYR